MISGNPYPETPHKLVNLNLDGFKKCIHGLGHIPIKVDEYEILL